MLLACMAGVILVVPFYAILQLLIERLAELSLWIILAMLPVVIAGGYIALGYPILSLAGCVAVAFSSSSAVLHDKYGLPVLTKYLPWILLAGILIQIARSSNHWLVPASARISQRLTDKDLTWFWLCISFVCLYLVTTLIPMFYASNQELAAEEFNLQVRYFCIALSVGIGVNWCGKWSSLQNMTTLALYSTTTTIFLAIMGSVVPSLQPILPGFMTVYESVQPGGIADRIAGAYAHPNSLGRYALFMLPIALALVATSSRYQRLMAAVCTLILLTGLILSESRGALLVLMLLSIPGIVVFARYIRWRYLFASLVLAAALISLAWQYVDSDRVARTMTDFESMLVHGESPSDGATRGRLSEMRIAYEIWKENPLVGVGLANYEHYFQTFSYKYGTKLYNADRSAHSLYLEILAERGIVGFVGFAIAIGGLLLAAIRCAAIVHGEDKSAATLRLSLCVSTVAYFISAVFLHDVHAEPLWGLLGLLIASSKGVTYLTDKTTDTLEIAGNAPK